MNPMTNMKNIKKLSEQELQRNFKTSWHDQYRGSAWIFVGGIPYDLTEGDIICVFSQYGEIVNINLVRDKDTGKQKGFCFICYEDQRSTDLAVDNFNGIKILGRTIRVDHVTDYKMPKEQKTLDSETKKLHSEGCGPNVKPEKRPELPIPSTEVPSFAKEVEAPPDGFRLPPRLPIGQIKIEKEDNEETATIVKVQKEKKQKKDKKHKKKSKKKHKKKVSSSESSDSETEEDEDSSSEEDKKRKRNRKSHKDKEDESRKTEPASAKTEASGKEVYNHREEYLKAKREHFDKRKDNSKYLKR